MRTDIRRVIRIADDLLKDARDPKFGIVGVSKTADPVRARIDGYWHAGNTQAALEAAWHYFTIAQSFSAGMVMKRAIRSGRKQNDGADRSNAAKTRTAVAQRNDWQKRADAVWKKNPHLSALQVAKKIATTGENPDTIRRKLAKPVAVTTP